MRKPFISPEISHSRSARLILLIALSLVLLSSAQLLYRFALPTDGWDVYESELDEPNLIYWENLVGAPSPLQPEDTLVAVEGLDMRGQLSLEFVAPPAGWLVGRQVTMTILREGAELSIAVPVVHWTPAAWWRYNVLDLSRQIDFLGALLLFGVGLFTFLKRPAVPSARALLILCAAFFSASISGSLPDGLSVKFNTLAIISTGFFSYVIFGTVVAPSLFAFALHFPRPKRAIVHRPWLGLLPYGLGLAILVALLSCAPAVTVYSIDLPASSPFTFTVCPSA